MGKSESESWQQYYSRHTSAARDLYHNKYGFASLATLYVQRLFDGAASCLRRLGADMWGRLSRNNWPTEEAWTKVFGLLSKEQLPSHYRLFRPVACFAACSLFFRDDVWWEHCRGVMLEYDSNNLLSWRHLRRGPIISWEKCFVDLLGSNWKVLAVSPRWKARLLAS